jgi:hypothetical protein
LKPQVIALFASFIRIPRFGIEHILQSHPSENASVNESLLPATAAAPSVDQLLADLHDKYEEGIITEEVYTREKVLLDVLGRVNDIF